MAGSWLKMRHDLADDPAVIRLATATQLEDDAVIGKLFRLWSWADRHTVDGAADGVQLAWVDRLTGCQGFGAALVRVGWLVESDAGLSFPRFDRHCSDTAKARALTKTRVERHRNAPSVTQALPEEIREEFPPPPPREAAHSGEAWQQLRAAWNAGASPAARRRPWKPAQAPDEAEEVIRAAGWLDDALEAIPRLAGCRYFDSPVTLIQFTRPGFVQRVLGGQYDAPKTPKGQDRRDGDRPPIRVDPEFEAMRAATLAREAARREAEHRRLDQAAADAAKLDDVRRSVAGKLRTAGG